MKNLLEKLNVLEKSFKECSEAIALLIERDVLKGGPGSGRRDGGGKPKDKPEKKPKKNGKDYGLDDRFEVGKTTRSTAAEQGYDFEGADKTVVNVTELRYGDKVVLHENYPKDDMMDDRYSYNGQAYDWPQDLYQAMGI